MSSKRYQIVCLLVGFASFATGLNADQVAVSWVGIAGNWSDASDWKPAVVPNNSGGTSYAVTVNGIGMFPTNPSVNVDINPTIDSLLIGGASGTVTVSGALTAGTVTGAHIGSEGGAPSQLIVSGTLNAGTVSFSGNGSSVSLDGTANIGTLTFGPCGGCTNWEISGLANVGTCCGGGIGVMDGTLNVSNSFGFGGGSLGVGGTITVGTGNLASLNSTATFVNAGSAGIGGFVSLGAPSLSFGSAFAVGSNATYDEVISGSSSFGTLTVSNTPSDPVSLDGTLVITLADSFIPAVGQTFTIITSSSPLCCGPGALPVPIVGAFSNIEGQTFNNGTEMWDVDYSRTGYVRLIAAPAPLATPEPSMFGLGGLGITSIVLLRRRQLTKAAGPH